MHKLLMLISIIFVSCASNNNRLGKYDVMCEHTNEISRYDRVISITVLRDRFAILYSKGKGLTYVEKIDYFDSNKCWFSERN